MSTEPKPKQPPAQCADPSSRRRPRPLRRFASMLTLLALGVLLWTFGADRRDADAPASAAWGDEAARAQTVADLLPMAPANACGLGASSCFKCHNGKRARAPGADPAKAPWHAQHAKVNNSCVGCHRGNPRVMKEDVAHTKMLAKPRDDRDGSCASCHSADLDKVKAAYTAGGK